MRKRSNAMTGAMDYKRSLYKYSFRKYMFTLTTLRVDNLKTMLYPTRISIRNIVVCIW